VTDTISITLQDKLFDLDAHLADMDASGVDAALLHNASLNVFGQPACDALNEASADAARRHPGRFIACGHLAPQEAGSLDRLTRAVETLGLRAVALPTSTLGLGVDDPALTPLYDRLASWNLPLVLHPALRPSGADTRYQRERSLGREHDIAQALVALIYAVLPRFPRLRVVAPHCGGSFLFLKGRVRQFYVPEGTPPEEAAFARMRRAQESAGFGTPFERLCRQIYFDSCGHGAWEPALAYTVAVAGSDRVLFGTDYPLEANSGETLSEYRQLIDSLPLTPEQRTALLGGTAAELFGVAPAAGGATGAR
jgi:predicted TIM-barrel fold metal-dependent hydrolase